MILSHIIGRIAWIDSYTGKWDHALNGYPVTGLLDSDAEFGIPKTSTCKSKIILHHLGITPPYTITTVVSRVVNLVTLGKG